MRRQPPWCGLLALGTLACSAGWHRQPEWNPGPWKPKQQAQVWTEGRALRWHAVAVETDSMSGVSFLQPADCDSCRVKVALQQVDSVRIGNPMAGFWKTFGLVVGVPMLLIHIVCGWPESRNCFPET